MKSLAGAALGAILLPVVALAQDFPSRPVTMVVPFAAGGPTDTLGKLIAGAMTASLGQEVVVENVTGAGGTTGAARVAVAAADGYTVLLSNVGMAASVTFYRKLPYDPLAAFDAIGLVADVPMALVGRKGLAANDLAGLVAEIKAGNGTLTYANAGMGSGSHLCTMLFMSAAGGALTPVAYPGTGPAMADVVGGKIDVLCDQTTNSTEEILAGTVKAFAVTSPDRLATLPDLPTAAEAGLPDFRFGVWNGLFAPKGTPAAVIERLAGALRAALKDGHVTATLAALGAVPVGESEATPAALRAKLAAEIERWRPLIEAAGVYAD